MGMVRFFRLAAAAALAPTLAVLPAAAGPHGPDKASGPDVPVNIEVPDGFSVFEQGHAVGTQNYICLLSPAGMAWTFIGPEATLFTAHKGRSGQQNMTHFLSANPYEVETLRPTWQDSADSSRVWGRAIGSSADPQYVEAGAIPWLLLEAVDTQRGTTRDGTLTGTKFIHRVNTSGGAKPTTGCTASSEIGALKLVPYEADYHFYQADRRRR